ncbi:MAB_1171c family putative transporter [Kitasatospora phosalacinea]|uniref:MAB_1171c family putative transporter n=1 Tax=Kitasatospora phosalacinea TaxID=2065 RepID=A0ABW6GHF3_9ACTN
MSAVRAVDVALLVPSTLGTVWMGRVTLPCGRRRERALWGAMALVTLAIAAGVPAVRRLIDVLLGVASVTNLVVHLLTLGATGCLVEFIHQAAGERDRPAAPVRALPFACAALTAVFAAMPRPDGEQDLLTQAETGWSLAYWGIVTLYLGWGLAVCARTSLRYGRLAVPGPLRTSLRLLAAGSLTGLLYLGHRSLYLALHDAAPGLFDNAAVLATTQGLTASAVLLLTVGIAWPSLAERLRTRRTRARIRRLHPLWQALHDAVPEVALPLPPTLKGDPDVVLYRYVIEIRDAALAVGAFEDGAVRARASELLTTAGVAGASLEAAAEAVAVRCAVLRARQRTGGTRSPEARPGDGAGHDGLEAEVAWLEQVAAYFHTPVAARTADRIAAELD